LHSSDGRYEVAGQHNVRVNKSEKIGTGDLFHCFKKMADQGSSKRGSVDARNLTKAKLFTTLPNPRFIAENNDFASRAERPAAKGVTLNASHLSDERLTGSEKG
jgi:hypothetical protein